MGYIPLSSEQIKVALNATQLFETLEGHRQQARSVAGSMHWKRINGRDYLYRAYSYGKNQSLGPRSHETEQTKVQFEARQQAYREQESQLRDQFTVHSAYIRANRLNRFPLAGARVIRALQRQNVPFRVIGTNALYAYEARAGIQFQAEHLATDDMDVLMDARQGVRIVTNLKRRSLLSLLQSSDKTFQRVSSSPYEFCAANARGYRVDFITQGGDPMHMNDFERLLDSDDLKPVTISSLKWQVSAPRFEAVVFDERGMPLRVHTTDPRAFVLHKWYVSQQPDRQAMKRARDEDQARLVATLLRNELADLPTTRAVNRIFPHTVSQHAVDALDDLDL